MERFKAFLCEVVPAAIGGTADEVEAAIGSAVVDVTRCVLADLCCRHQLAM
jgi:hypothetical protein